MAISSSRGVSTAHQIFITAALVWMLVQTQASAQGSTPFTTTSISLAQALDLAWQRQPAAITAPSKAQEIAARQQAAGSLLAGSPAVSLVHRTDRLTGNGGLREIEAELGLPLWNAGTRRATQRQLDAELRGLEPAQLAAKLQLAGQLREAAGAIALAQLERELAQQKLHESVQLSNDTARRLRAGDVARLDTLQSQLAQAQAQAALNTAQAQLQQAQVQWQGLTGTMRMPMLSDAAPAISSVSSSVTSTSTLPDSHPNLLVAQAHLDTSKAKLRLAEADRADPMDLSVGVSRERSAFGNVAERNLRLALRIPLSTSSRNAPRIAAARAELDVAQTELDHQRRLLSNELEQAHAALSLARANEQATQQRLSIAQQVHEIVLRAYNLGERDLPTRLRADSEKFEAELTHARAQLETRRAFSKLQQQLGLLP